MLYVSYYRVSTKKQETSHLSLDAQQALIRAYIKQGDTLIAEYTEVESGRKIDRPQLASAVKAAKKSGATLLVAKLDRLSRNTIQVLQLISQVPFICVEQPGLNRMSIGILALVAEAEVEMISARIKSALAQAKLRGTVLGANGKNLGKIIAEKSDKFAESIRQRLEQHIAEGWSANRIAQAFNADRVPTARGGKWQATQVLSLSRRLYIVAA